MVLYRFFQSSCRPLYVHFQRETPLSVQSTSHPGKLKFLVIVDKSIRHKMRYMFPHLQNMRCIDCAISFFCSRTPTESIIFPSCWQMIHPLHEASSFNAAIILSMSKNTIPKTVAELSERVNREMNRKVLRWKFQTIFSKVFLMKPCFDKWSRTLAYTVALGLRTSSPSPSKPSFNTMCMCLMKTFWTLPTQGCSTPEFIKNNNNQNNIAQMFLKL